MTPAFITQGLTKRYPDFSLEGVSLELPTGSVMGLVGANGAGKTTLLRLLAGLASADAGEVEVLGHRLPEQQAEARRDVGLASEDMRLYRSRSLEWHIDLVRRIYPTWDDSYAQALMGKFDLRPRQLLGGFSHGQRVKALLLLCLARRPKLLLLDEPTTGLDPVARLEVLEALADVLRDERRSVLFSSHNTADVEQMADRIAFLHRGRLVADADKEQFLEQWRRVLCTGSPAEPLSEWPEVALVRSSGSQLELRVRAWNESMPHRLVGAGLRVERVDPMSLEEIFVTAVRTGGAA